MKILLLGGCADMAVPMIKYLKDDGEVSEVLLADLNEEKVKKIAEENGEKFAGIKCDANDYNEVVSLMKGKDVAFCYIGPFYIFEKKLAKCALDSGVNYVSISDDYDAYLEVIDLDEEAKQKNVKILTGFGNSPGLTQILARKGYNSLDKTKKINISWTAGSDEDAGVSNLTHLFHIFNGTTLQWFDSKEKNGKPAYIYYTYVGHIAELTSVPAYLGAKWLFKNKFNNKPGGVYSGERLLDIPDEFIKEMESMGIEIFESDIKEI